MSNRVKNLIYAAIIGLIVVAIFLGFLTGFTNPISWLLIVVLLLIPLLDISLKTEDKISWKEEYSVGIQHIDDDHKKLISLLNQFMTAYDYAMSEEFERKALDDLISYTKYHFEREEKLLEKYKFPNIEEHKAQHAKMIEYVNSFVYLYNKKGHNALNEISEFLSDWLINHINGSDKEYSKFLNERGVQ